MALFNERDARAAHTLTQLYQLESEEELRAYYKQWPCIRPNRRNARENEDFPHLWKLCQFSKEVLDIVADKAPFTAEWWGTAEEWLSRITRRLGVLPGREMFNIEDIQEMMNAEVSMSYFEAYILDELYSVLRWGREEKVVVRCAQCSSAYLPNPSKPEMRYCSERCANRARVERYQRKRKNAEHSRPILTNTVKMC